MYLWGLFVVSAYILGPLLPPVDPKTGRRYAAPNPGHKPTEPKLERRLENRLWAFLQSKGYFKDKTPPWIKK